MFLRYTRHKKNGKEDGYWSIGGQDKLESVEQEAKFGLGLGIAGIADRQLGPQQKRLSCSIT